MSKELTKEEEIAQVYKNVAEASINLHNARKSEENTRLLTIKAQKAYLIAKEAQWALERGL